MADRKRVLGIVGSPRRGGNTEILVDEILAGAAEAGAQVEKVILEEIEIGPCKACYSCRETGRCVIEDDLHGVIEKMNVCGVWVLGTPVYWWGPSAQMKAFVDRWFSRAVGEPRQETFGGRRLIIAAPMGDTDLKTGRHVKGMFEDACAHVKAELFRTILAPGAYNKGDVRKNTEVMQEARKIGAAATA